MGTNDNRMYITTTDDRKIECTEFLSFGFDNDAIAVSGNSMYLKQKNGTYALLSPASPNDKKKPNG